MLAGETTYFGDNTADDDLLFASGLDGSTEVSVVPGVDFTIPVDNGNIGIHLSDLREERAFRALTRRRISRSAKKMTSSKHTLIRAGGDDHREVVGLAKASVKEEVVVHFLGGVVTDAPYETDLVVDDEHGSVVLVDPLKRICSDWVNTKSPLATAHRE